MWASDMSLQLLNIRPRYCYITVVFLLPVFPAPVTDSHLKLLPPTQSKQPTALVRRTGPGHFCLTVSISVSQRARCSLSRSVVNSCKQGPKKAEIATSKSFLPKAKQTKQTSNPNPGVLARHRPKVGVVLENTLKILRGTQCRVRFQIKRFTSNGPPASCACSRFCNDIKRSASASTVAQVCFEAFFAS